MAAFTAFVDEVRQSLLRGDRHQTPGLGTFYTCTRKAAPGRAACTMVAFRADPKLRAGEIAPDVAGEHAAVVATVVGALAADSAVELPALGRIERQAHRGKQRVIFRAARELNDALSAP